MLRRASALVGGELRARRGRHVPLLRQHGAAPRTARRVGLEPGFTILDRGDAEDVINLLRARAGLDRKERRFPRKNAIVEIFSMAVNRSTTVAGAGRGRATATSSTTSTTSLRLRRAVRALQARAEPGRLRRPAGPPARPAARRTATSPSSSRARTATSWSTSTRTRTALQAEIVRGLAVDARQRHGGRRRRQSIYSFRGADFRNIMDFPTLFPGTRAHHARGELPLDAADPRRSPTRSSTAPREKHTKMLCTRQRRRAQRRCWCSAPDEQTQSRFVCQRILELREEGVPLDEIAVLFRSSFHSFDLELELQRARHPVRQARRLQVHRDGAREGRARAPARGREPARRGVVAPRPAAARRRRARRRPTTCSRTSARRPTLEEAAERLGDLSAARRVHEGARPPGARCCARSRPTSVPPGEQVARVVGFYAPMLRHVHRDDFPKREKDLEHFVTIAARYRSLASLLTDMALEPPTDSVGDVLAAERRRGPADALDHPLGQGPRVAHRLRHLAGRRPLPVVPQPRTTTRRSRRSGACSTSPSRAPRSTST